MYIYIYIYIYIYVHRMCIYIYIYIYVYPPAGPAARRGAARRARWRAPLGIHYRGVQ